MGGGGLELRVQLLLGGLVADYMKQRGDDVELAIDAAEKSLVEYQQRIAEVLEG